MKTIVIDCTPSWLSLAPIIAEQASQGKQIATEELSRMARLADFGAAMLETLKLKFENTPDESCTITRLQFDWAMGKAGATPVSKKS